MVFSRIFLGIEIKEPQTGIWGLEGRITLLLIRFKKLALKIFLVDINHRTDMLGDHPF
jgi:hypothetical protein